MVAPNSPLPMDTAMGSQNLSSQGEQPEADHPYINGKVLAAELAPRAEFLDLGQYFWAWSLFRPMQCLSGWGQACVIGAFVEFIHNYSLLSKAQ